MFSTILVQDLDIQKMATISTMCASLFSIAFGFMRLIKQRKMLNYLRDIWCYIKAIENDGNK